MRRLSRGYNARGLLETVTSANSPIVGVGAISSQVQLEYNGFGQLLHDYQTHGDVVFPESTLRVIYTYAAGTINSIRPLTVTYPNGRTLTYEYGLDGSVDRLRGRIHEIKDADSSVLARYTHRGIKSTVRIEYVELQVDLTYIKLTGEPNGDAGDQYTGPDRFGCIVDVRWLKTGTSDAVDRFQYTFDRASNRTARLNLTAPTNDWNEVYDYDGLYQLRQLTRGPAPSAPCQENITYDPTGNRLSYNTFASGSVILEQGRTHNQANEITAILGSPGEVGYDPAGNMTVMPRTGHRCRTSRQGCARAGNWRWQLDPLAGGESSAG